MTATELEAATLLKLRASTPLIGTHYVGDIRALEVFREFAAWLRRCRSLRCFHADDDNFFRLTKISSREESKLTQTLHQIGGSRVLAAAPTYFRPAKPKIKIMITYRISISELNTPDAVTSGNNATVTMTTEREVFRQEFADIDLRTIVQLINKTPRAKKKTRVEK